MNWLDIVILVLIVIPVIIGLKKGVVKAAFTVAGMVIGVMLAGRFSDSLGGAMSFIPDPGWAKIIAFAIIIIVVMIIAVVAARLVTKLLKATMLNWINQLGGAVLGLVLGGIFCAAILSIWVQFLGPGETITESALASFLLDKFPFILGLLPDEFEGVREFFQ